MTIKQLLKLKVGDKIREDNKIFTFIKKEFNFQTLSHTLYFKCKKECYGYILDEFFIKKMSNIESLKLIKK